MVHPTLGTFELDYADDGFPITPVDVPISPEPLQGFQDDTALITRLGGPHVAVAATRSPIAALLTPAPSCGCRTCAAREAHNRVAIGLCCLAFVTLLAVYVAKVR